MALIFPIYYLTSVFLGEITSEHILKESCVKLIFKVCVIQVSVTTVVRMTKEQNKTKAREESQIQNLRCSLSESHGFRVALSNLDKEVSL